jgi:hypothetical protein
MYNRHQTGHKSELVAAAWYVENEYEIYCPCFTQSSCDFIAVKNKEIKRVQVKTAYTFSRPSGANYVQATTRKGPAKGNICNFYTKDDCDEIVIVYQQDLWVIPVEHLNGLQSVVLFKDVKFPRKSSADFKAEQYKVTKQ